MSIVSHLFTKVKNVLWYTSDRLVPLQENTLMDNEKLYELAEIIMNNWLKQITHGETLLVTTFPSLTNQNQVEQLKEYIIQHLILHNCKFHANHVTVWYNNARVTLLH